MGVKSFWSDLVVLVLLYLQANFEPEMAEGYKTAQEKFWADEFGRAYIQRNARRELLARAFRIVRIHFFPKMTAPGFC